LVGSPTIAAASVRGALAELGENRLRRCPLVSWPGEAERQVNGTAARAPR
jgi:hypothetical protein